MLSPEYLAIISDSLQNGVYAQLQEDILCDVVRRLKKTDYDISETASWQLQKLSQSGMLNKEILSRISAATGKGESELKKIFEDAALENLLDVDADIADPIEFLKQSDGTMDILAAGLQKTGNTLKNFTLSTAESVQSAYFAAADLAYLQIQSGAFDYNTAIYNATKTVLESGAPYVTYPSGHIDRVDVAVRRAVMTGVANTTNRVSLNLARDLSCDYVLVSAHAGARDSHAAWQGKIYCISGKDDNYPKFETATGFGSGDGLGGWNCRHSISPTTKDSPSPYDAKYLRELNEAKVTYNGEEIPLYDATQRQRAAERKMRAERRKLTALSEIKDDSAAAQAEFSRIAQRLKGNEASYRDFCRQTGLASQKERLRTVGYGRSVSASAVWADRKEYEKFRKAYSLNGEGLPKTIAEYRDIKYNDLAEYTRIRKYCAVVNHGELSPLLGYAVYKAKALEIEDKLIGITAVNGMKIKDYSAHFVGRALGHSGLSDKYNREGVEVDTIKDALLNGKVGKTQTDSVRLDSDSCMVSINPHSGILIQTNGRKEK